MEAVIAALVFFGFVGVVFYLKKKSDKGSDDSKGPGKMPGIDPKNKVQGQKATTSKQKKLKKKTVNKKKGKGNKKVK